MRFHGPDDPVYIISVASRLLGQNPHVLRMLEREGLLAPARTEKNIRLYSENDLMRLSYICRLMQEDGVNLAGVRAILRMETRDGTVTITVSSESTGERLGSQDEVERPTGSGRSRRSSGNAEPSGRRDGWF